MELFCMPRYDEDNADSREASIRQKKILENLKQKAKKRKSEKGEKSNDLENKVHADEDELEIKPTPVAEGGADVQSEEPRAKKKSKKRKKDPGSSGETGFTLLGESLSQAPKRVRRVLPAWLANPDIVSIDYSQDQLAVSDLRGLDDKTISHLKANRISHFFPVQRQVIPWLLNSGGHAVFRPSDICVSAPTGSGKTLAYVLPIVQVLQSRVVPRVRALVILPVQDLAAQVYKVFLSYCAGTGLRVKLLSAQRSFAQEQSELVHKSLVSGSHEFHSLVDILVATPGRIVDHVQKTEGFSLSHLRYLVIDEADRVMEDIQNDWLTHVEGSVYQDAAVRSRPGPLTVHSANQRAMPLQKLLFSATLSQNPEQLEHLNLFEPKLFSSVVKPKDILANANKAISDDLELVGQYTTPAELSEYIVICKDSMKKPQMLFHLLQSMKVKKALVFAKSVEHTHFLAVLLKAYGLRVAELSSQISGRRSRILNQFAAGDAEVLVSSDALARGIDIGQIDHVVSYDCPKFIRTYIHRVGRTARAGRPGSAFTLVEQKEATKFNTMLRKAGKTDDLEEFAIKDKDLDNALYEKAKEEASGVIASEKEKEPRKKSQTK